MQDTFTRCVQNHDRIRDNQFRIYLLGIAYNVLAHLRARYRDGTPLDTSQASVHDLAPSPAALVVRRREHRLLLEALRTISI